MQLEVYPTQTPSSMGTIYLEDYLVGRLCSRGLRGRAVLWSNGSGLKMWFILVHTTVPFVALNEPVDSFLV